MTTEQHGSKTEGRGERGLLQTALELFEDLPACQTPGTDAYTWRYHVSDYLNGNDNLTGEPGRGDEAVGRSDEEMERAIEQSEVEFFKELRRRGASPPSQPEGVREALEKIKALYDDVTTVVRDFKTPQPWFNYKVERSKGYLYGLSGNGLIASGTIGTYKEFELICEILNNLPLLLSGTTPSRGLVEAAEWPEIANALKALDEAGGAALGIAMSTEHPNADEVLTNIFHSCNKASGDLRKALRTLSAKPTANAADREGDRG